MIAAPLRILIAVALVLAATAWSAQAQFNIPGVRGLPVPIPGRGRHLHRVLPGLSHGHFRRIFGIAATVAIGSIILGNLSKRDQEELGRRARVAIYKDSDQRVVETYRTQDGRDVTITADPAQRVSDIKDDPALRQTAATSEQSGKQTTKKKADEPLKVSELPPDTQCRKVTTQLEIRPTGSEQKVDPKTSNTSILCQTKGGEWKPASA